MTHESPTTSRSGWPGLGTRTNERANVRRCTILFVSFVLSIHCTVANKESHTTRQTVLGIAVALALRAGSSGPVLDVLVDGTMVQDWVNSFAVCMANNGHWSLLCVWILLHIKLHLKSSMEFWCLGLTCWAMGELRVRMFVKEERKKEDDLDAWETVLMLSMSV